MEVASSALSLVETCLKLFDRLHASYKKHKQLPKSVESLRKDLRSIKEAIETRSGTADQDGIRSWIADLKEIWQMIEDAVDLYNFRVRSESSRKGWRGWGTRVKDVFASPSTKLLDDIDEIKKEVTATNQRVMNHHPPQSPHHGQTTVREEEQVYQHPKEARPEGLDKPKAELVRMLSGGNNTTLSIVAIFGPGGSGKSVLAEAAYNHVQEQENFEYKAWVTASHNVNNLLGAILDQLGLPRPPPSTNLSHHLRGLLHKKRYIIGIDGLDTTGYWNDILHACPDDNMSSVIIVTTMKEEIARSCHKNCPIPFYKMLPLDKGSAQALLLRKAFGEQGCPNHLDDKALTMILETCEYLPVAIANMGDHIRSVKEWDYTMCVDTCNNIGSLLVNKKNGAFIGMNHVLNRSYTSLSDNAKTLLLSLSTCPINTVIKRKSLIRRCLAESRLVVCTHNQSAEDLANECFNALREQNFIIPVKFSINGQVKAFRVHRMTLQFIKDKAISENFVTCLDMHSGKKVEPHGNINRLSLHNCSSESPPIERGNDLSRVRSLSIHGTESSALMDSFDSILLRVLVLENIGNMTDDHLKTICRPSMLKYLSIRGNKNVSTLPKNIRKLQYLETLDTRNTNVDKIQMDILPPELVHLFGEFQILCNSNVSTKLQTLAGFFIDKSQDFVKLLPDIPKLSKVRILCQNSAPSKEVTDDLIVSLQRCFEGVLSRPNLHLRSLTIDFHGVSDINFMDDLEVPSPCFLQSLKLCGNLITLPKFILSDSLIELCLSGTNIGADVLVQLQSLQKLQFLKLNEDPFFEEDKVIFWRKGSFMELKRLCFIVQKMPKIVIEEKAMESLESLQLLCTELGGFSGIEHLLRLEELILPSNVTGADVDDLSQQLSEHLNRPKFLRPPADADGSIQSGRMLVRSQRLNKREVREN